MIFMVILYILLMLFKKISRFIINHNVDTESSSFDWNNLIFVFQIKKKEDQRNRLEHLAPKCGIQKGVFFNVFDSSLSFIFLFFCNSRPFETGISREMAIVHFSLRKYLLLTFSV